MSVGGFAPLVTRASDPRAEETLRTFGSLDALRSGRKSVATKATDVTFVSRTVAQEDRKFGMSFDGDVGATPALLIRTIVEAFVSHCLHGLQQSDTKDVLKRWLNRKDDRSTD